MKQIRLYPLIAVAALHYGYKCHAQEIQDTTNNIKFLPRTHVIFEDDFNADKNGSFPKHWRMTSPCDEDKLYFSSSYCEVQRTKDTAFLSVMPTRKNTLENFIQPDVKNNKYLPDDFTLEYDFSLETQNTLAGLLFEFGHRCLDQAFSVYSTEDGDLMFSFEGWIGADGHSYKENKKISACSNFNEWHHFALSYDNHNLKCYVDTFLVFNTPDCGYTPTKFILTSNGGTGKARYANIRLATGKQLTQKELNDFNKLLREKKLMTHTILFDINSAHIKPESIDYVKSLAFFLRRNKEIKLEIDGHTDNTGLAEYNKLLSEKRAREIKRQLVINGIATSRLQTKGLGSSQPITPNITDADKAANRRVEFKVIN